jgi:hypothetical protein
LQYFQAKKFKGNMDHLPAGYKSNPAQELIETGKVDDDYYMEMMEQATAADYQAYLQEGKTQPSRTNTLSSDEEEGTLRHITITIKPLYYIHTRN